MSFLCLLHPYVTTETWSALQKFSLLSGMFPTTPLYPAAKWYCIYDVSACIAYPAEPSLSTMHRGQIHKSKQYLNWFFLQKSPETVGKYYIFQCRYVSIMKATNKKCANMIIPRSMLILWELYNMVGNVRQLYARYLVVAEIFQQLTATGCILWCWCAAIHTNVINPNTARWKKHTATTSRTSILRLSI